MFHADARRDRPDVEITVAQKQKTPGLHRGFSSFAFKRKTISSCEQLS